MEAKSIGNVATIYGSLRRRWKNLMIAEFQDGGSMSKTADLLARTTRSELTMAHDMGIEIAMIMMKAIIVPSFMTADPEWRFSKNTT